MAVPAIRLLLAAVKVGTYLVEPRLPCNMIQRLSMAVMTGLRCISVAAHETVALIAGAAGVSQI